MPAPTEIPIYNLEDALGLNRHNFSCPFYWQPASLLFLYVSITAEGGRMIGIGTFTLYCEVHHAQPVVRPGHDMMTCTATSLSLLINDH